MQKYYIIGYTSARRTISQVAVEAITLKLQLKAITLEAEHTQFTIDWLTAVSVNFCVVTIHACSLYTFLSSETFSTILVLKLAIFVMMSYKALMIYCFLSMQLVHMRQLIYGAPLIPKVTKVINELKENISELQDQVNPKILINVIYIIFCNKSNFANI